MALRNVLLSKPAAPYARPPPLHIKVLLVAQRPKVLSWEFDHNSAKAKIIKNNISIAITDGLSVVKMTIFEENASKVSAGQSFVMKGYNLRGESPPFIITVTRETTFYRSSPVSVEIDFMKEANDLLYPPSKLSPVAEVRDGVGLLTVEGQIIQLSVVKKVRSGREEVPLRHLKMEQDRAQVTLCLWREAAVENLEIGARIQASHLKLTRSSYGEQLQTTSYTQIEVVHSSSDAMVEVLGVTETRNDGILELLLSTDELVEIEKSLWEPFDDLLSKQRVYVQLIRNGGKVVKIEGVQPPAES